MIEQSVAERGADNRKSNTTPVQKEIHIGRKSSNLRILTIGAAVLVFFIVAFIVGILPRLRQRGDLEAAAAEVANQTPRVSVVVARKGTVAAKQVLPGSAMPYQEAAIYARTTGYLKERLVEIGDQVEKDKLLAVIATPEIDAQLELARATLLQTKDTLTRDTATETLAKANLERAEDLWKQKQKGIAKQEYETAVAEAAAAAATVLADLSKIKANDAEIHRLEALQSFQQVKAPFAGVITAKNVDPGALVTADSPNTTKELFHLMQIDTLRVFVNVPQVYAANVKVGQTAAVYQRDDPQQKFPGKVTRTANALDPSTRTLLTEVQVANPKGALLPGMYLQVQFTFERAAIPVLIPGAALATRSAGPRVAVLDAQHRVHYQPVQLGHDFGTEIEVIAGLSPGDLVIVHPGDDLPDGVLVEPVNLPKK